MVPPDYARKQTDKMTITSLSKSVAVLIAADVALVERNAKSRFVLVDSMVAEGLRSTDFKSPKVKGNGSTATPELYAALKDAVTMGFSAADRVLIATTAPSAVAALKPEKAARRTYLQQQIGSRMKDYGNALKRREEPTQDGAGGRKRPAQDRFFDHMSKAINVLREESEFTFAADVMITLLEKAVNAAKATAKPAKK